MALLEVTDPDRFDRSVFIELLHRLPAFGVGLFPPVSVGGGIGPVDEVQVEVFNLEFFHRLLCRLKRFFIPSNTIPQLGGNKDLLPPDAAVGNRLTDFSFIFICCGGINVPVSHLQCGTDAFICLIRRDLPRSKPDDGNFDPVAERFIFHFVPHFFKVLSYHKGKSSSNPLDGAKEVWL